MTVIIEVVGQELRKGQNPSAIRRYQIQGTTDKATAYALVNAASPIEWEGLIKQGVSVEEAGEEIWDGNVNYGISSGGMGGGGDPSDPRNIGWSFEIGTMGLHITQARSHVQSYDVDGNIPDRHKGAIGVRKDGSGNKVEGVDISIPQFQWEETHFVAYETAASHAFIQILENAVGKINEDAFRIWGPKELLLLGVSGAKRGEEPVGLTYRFASSRTRTNLAVGDITVAEKLGHDYLWIEYEKKEDAAGNVLTAVPIAVHVEQVYQDHDWTAAGLTALLPDPWV